MDYMVAGYETIDLERAKECNAATLRDQIDKAHEAVQSKAGRRRGKGDPETGRNHPRRAGQKRLKQTSVPNGRTSVRPSLLSLDFFFFFFFGFLPDAFI